MYMQRRRKHRRAGIGDLSVDGQINGGIVGIGRGGEGMGGTRDWSGGGDRWVEWSQKGMLAVSSGGSIISISR
jgi:hypothetical protein